MPLHFWEQCGHKRSVELPAGDAFFVWVDLPAGLMALVGTSALGLALGGATVGALVGTSASGLALGGAQAWALGRASASGLAMPCCGTSPKSLLSAFFKWLGKMPKNSDTLHLSLRC